MKPYGVVVDTSALVAMLLGEPEASRFDAIASASARVYVSAVSLLEASMVMGARNGLAGRDALDKLLVQLNATIEPFEGQQAVMARQAWERFGKGRHPAALNMGDCASYACARALGLPLLFKGQDFPLTDIEPGRDS